MVKKTSRKIFGFPFPKGTITEPVIPGGKLGHKAFPESRYAVDLPVKLGTPVLASRGGKVTWARSRSKKHFHPNKVSSLPTSGIIDLAVKYTNGVTIKHNDETYSEYLHVKAKVKIGQKVRKGQKIGTVDMSGITSEPHLHFNVFEIKGKKVLSILFKFEDL